MKRLTMVFLALAMVMVIAPTAALADTTVNLIAGQHYDVGDVTVTSDGTNLYVKFDITDPDYYLYSTAVDVRVDYNKIPQKNGNPIPGKFAYKMSHSSATSYTQVIPIMAAWRGKTVAIAAHADVAGLFGDLKELSANLPAQVTEEIQLGTESYMTKTITDGFMLNGVWDGWCINSSFLIEPGVPYRANVFSSYADPTLLTFLEKPENLGAVNWFMNNSDGVSMQMKQAAIWKLLSFDPDLQIMALGVDPADPALKAIVDEALMYMAFQPMKGDYVAILLNPFTDTGAWVQPDMILIKLVGDETAWGQGTDFWGANWAMWFSYDVPQ